MRSIWLITGWILVGVIIYLSIFIPPATQPSESQIDKFKHFIAYGTLMFWFAQGFRDKPRLIIAGALIAMGIAIEFIQPMTGREFSGLDMLANTGGVLIALFIASKGGDFLYPKLQKPQ